MKRWALPIAFSLLFHALLLYWATLWFCLPEEPRQRQIAIRLVRMPAFTAHGEAENAEKTSGPAPTFEEPKTGQTSSFEENEKEISNNNLREDRKDIATKAKSIPRAPEEVKKEVKKSEDAAKSKSSELSDTKALLPPKEGSRIDFAQREAASLEQAETPQNNANGTPSSAPSPTNNSPAPREGARFYAQSDVIKEVKPIYPLASRRRGEEGTVLLEVIVDPSGTVEEVRIAKSSGYPLLDRAAVRALKEWRFREGSGPIFLVPVQFLLQ